MQCLYSYWLFNRAVVYMGADNASALFWQFFGNRLSVSNISNKYSAPPIFTQSTVCSRVQYSSYVKINLKLLWHVSWIYLFDRKRSTFCNRLDSLSSRFSVSHTPFCQRAWQHSCKGLYLWPTFVCGYHCQILGLRERLMENIF